MHESISHLRRAWCITFVLLILFRIEIPVCKPCRTHEKQRSVASYLGLYCLPTSNYGALGLKGLINPSVRVSVDECRAMRRIQQGRKK